MARANQAAGEAAVGDIEHIKELPGDPLGGASGAKRFHVLFVGKRATEKYPYQVVNDRVATEIARTLGLWAPDSVLYPVAGEYAFFSHFVELEEKTASGETRPPRGSDAHEAVIESPRNRSYRHGVVMFDLFVANNDRKADNLLVDRHDRIWLIDHGNALFYRPYRVDGQVRPPGVPRLEAVQADARTIFDREHHYLRWLDRWDLVEEWADRIAALPTFYVRHLVESLPAGVVTEAERRALTEFLLNRRAHMMDVVELASDLFPSLDGRER